MKVKLKHLYYYIFLVCLMLYYVFRKTTVDYTIFNFAMYLSIPFILLKVISEKYTMKEAVIILLLTVLGSITAITSGNVSILAAFCVAIGMKKVDYKTALKIVFWMRLGATLLLVLLSTLNVIENTVKVRTGKEEVLRYALGYSSPNTFGLCCFVLVSLWFILYGKKGWKWKTGIALLINIVQYKITNSRTAFIMLLFLLILVVLSHGVLNLRTLKKLTVFSIWAGTITSIIVPLLYNAQGILYRLNLLLNSRISLSKSYIRVYGFRLFGSDIGMSMTEGSYWFLDSGYLNLFISFGVIAGMVFLLMFTGVCNKKSQFNTYIYIAMIVFAVYALSENVLASFVIDYLWIIMGAALFEMLDKHGSAERKDLLQDSR